VSVGWAHGLTARLWLAYRWQDYSRSEWRGSPTTGRVGHETRSQKEEMFYDGGWSGMGWLQIIVWF
jgi:hypothetical protein